MNTGKIPSAIILGIGIFLGLAALGALLGDSLIKFKEYERTVTVKGLSEREFPADIVIWPIKFTEASNDLGALYTQLESSNKLIREYLLGAGIEESAVSLDIPLITDKSAQMYGNDARPEFRFLANQTVTVLAGSSGQ